MEVGPNNNQRNLVSLLQSHVNTLVKTIGRMISTRLRHRLFFRATLLASPQRYLPITPTAHLIVWQNPNSICFDFFLIYADH